MSQTISSGCPWGVGRWPSAWKKFCKGPYWDPQITLIFLAVQPCLCGRLDSSIGIHKWICRDLPWEPTTFIFRGNNPYFEGLKPLFFMVLGSNGTNYLTHLATHLNAAILTCPSPKKSASAEGVRDLTERMVLRCEEVPKTGGGFKFIYLEPKWGPLCLKVNPFSKQGPNCGPACQQF